jgi:hypothetical protein
MNLTDITEEQFRTYEAVRTSGVTNMFDVPMVCDLSGLSREEALAIMKNYHALSDQYLNMRQL